MVISYINHDLIIPFVVNFSLKTVINVWNCLPSNSCFFALSKYKLLLIKLISPLTLKAWHNQPTTLSFVLLSKVYEKLLSCVCILIFCTMSHVVMISCFYSTFFVVGQSLCSYTSPTATVSTCRALLVLFMICILCHAGLHLYMNK